MNGDSLAKMHSRGIRLTGKKRPISPEIALDGEALGVHEKRIVVQEVDGQTVADFQGADEGSLGGGNDVGDNQGELGLAAAGDNRALDRVLSGGEEWFDFMYREGSIGMRTASMPTAWLLETHWDNCVVPVGQRAPVGSGS